MTASMRGFRAALAVAACAAMLAAATRSPVLSPLAWAGLVPLFLVLRRSGAIASGLLCWAAGFLYYSGMLWWLLDVDGMNPWNFAAGNLLSAWHFAAFGVVAAALRRRAPRWLPLACPAAWVCLEYAKNHLGFVSMPWGGLGYTQAPLLPVVKVAALAGVYGVSFLVVAVNASIASVAGAYLDRRGEAIGTSAPGESFLRSHRIPAWTAVGVVVAVAASSLCGWSLPGAANGGARALRVSLVQGNLYEGEKKLPGYTEKVFGTYLGLTGRAVAEKPRMIIWPSSSVPGRIPYDRFLVGMLGDVARKAGSYFLVGTAGFDKMDAEQRYTKRIANSAFLFTPEGAIAGRYDKIRLLPFDEYLPMRDTIAWPGWIAGPGFQDHHPGQERTIFAADSRRFGVLICWENYFPDQFREMAGRGVDFMVGMTNEGFTKSAVAHYQMLGFYVFRAVENHVAIARIASTGVSAIIDPDGAILAAVGAGGGKSIDVEGHVTGEVPLCGSRTVYNAAGDLFVGLLLVGLIASVFGRTQPVEEFRGRLLDTFASGGGR